MNKKSIEDYKKEIKERMNSPNKDPQPRDDTKSEGWSSEKLRRKTKEIIREDINYREHVKENLYYTVCIVKREVVDYFESLVDITDDVEKGGYMYGNREKFQYLVRGLVNGCYYYDYVQCRNIAEDPSTSYKPQRDCMNEVRFEAEECSRVHTHPSGNPPSTADLEQPSCTGFPNIVLVKGARGGNYLIAYTTLDTYARLVVTNTSVSVFLDRTLAQLCEDNVKPFRPYMSSTERYRERRGAVVPLSQV